MTKLRKILALVLVLALVMAGVGCKAIEPIVSSSESVTITVEETKALQEENDRLQEELNKINAEKEAEELAKAEAEATATTAEQLKVITPDETPLTKTPTAITAVAFTKSTDLTLDVGVTNRRSATTVPPGGAVTYASSAPEVAAVSTDGTVTTKVAGKTVISATSGEKATQYNLTVEKTAATVATQTTAPVTTGKSGALVGYPIVVNDKSTEAVKALYLNSSLEKYYFYSADDKVLGYILGKDANILQVKVMVGSEAPGNGGNWSLWFADQFNLYRGLDATEDTSSGSGSGSSSSGVDIEAFRQEVFRLTNKERVKAGMEELVWDDDVADYAQTRAEEIAELFSHSRPGGLEDGWLNGLAIGENIASGQATPQRVVTGWMNSKGHRAAIIADYSDCGNRFGVGCYQDSSGKLYWVQNFVWWDPEG